MRKFLMPSMEAREDLPVISMEEEVLMTGEAADDLAQAETEISEVERVEDLADALEDLAEVAETIEEATPTDLAMVETAARAALAGSDVEVEEVLPALESYAGTRISVETIRDTARRLWDNIVEMLKKVWEKVEGFFYKIVGTIPRLRKAAEALKDRAEATVGKSVEEAKTNLGGEAGTLAVGKAGPKTAGDVMGALDAVASQGEVVFKKYAATVADAGEKMASAIGEFSIEKPEESLKKVVQASRALKLEEISKLCSAKATNDTRWPNGVASLAPALPGGKSIVYVLGHFDESAGALAGAEARRRTYAEVVQTEAKKGDSIRSGEISTLSTGDAIAIAEKVLGICDQIEEYQRGKGAKDIAKARDKMKDAGAKATKAMEKDRKDAGAAPIAQYKAAINFNVAYGRWATTPMGSLASISLATCRAAIVVANKSLSNYK